MRKRQSDVERLTQTLTPRPLRHILACLLVEKDGVVHTTGASGGARGKQHTDVQKSVQKG